MIFNHILMVFWRLKSWDLVTWVGLGSWDLLDINRTRDKIAQAYRHTQRHMNNAWSEMISCSSCFAFYCFSSFQWFIQTIWDNSYHSSNYHHSLILTFFFLTPLSLYFLSTTSNLMLYLVQDQCELALRILYSIGKGMSITYIAVQMKPNFHKAQGWGSRFVPSGEGHEW